LSGITRFLGRLRSSADALDPGGSSRRVDRVAPWLFIGPELLIDQYAELRRRGVTHVVDLREEGSDDADSLQALGFRWRRIPILDRRAPTDAQLADLIAWLDADADPNVDQAVYLHCHAGLGRTPTVAIALLMQHNLTLAEAHRMVLAARPEAAPTTRQLEWLGLLDRALRDTPSEDERAGTTGPR
jgi:protein-tyrosine phosphatase